MPSTANLTPAASILSTERIVATTAAGATVGVLASGLPVSTATTTAINAVTAASLQKSANLGDVASVATSRTNLGLGTADNVTFGQVTTTGAVICGAELFLGSAEITDGGSTASLTMPLTNGALTTAEEVADGYQPLSAALTSEAAAGSVLTANTVFDDFYRSDRALDGDDGDGFYGLDGQTWDVIGDGAATAQIVSGRLVSNLPNNINGNFYASLAYGAPITEIGFVYGFTLDHPSDGTGPTLISNNTLGNLNDMLHLITSPVRYLLQIRVGGGAFVEVLNVPFQHALNVPYRLTMEIDAANDTVVVVGPDGLRTTVVDANIGAINPTCGTWQLYHGNGFISGVNMGPVKEGVLPLFNTHAQNADVSALYGQVMTRRRKYLTTTFTGVVAQWYRIMTRSLYATYEISGTLTLSAKNSLGSQTTIIEIFAKYGSSPVYMRQVKRNDGLDIMFAVRYSYDTSGTVQYLDLQIISATSITLTMDFTGIGELVAPTGPATAGTTYSQTLSLVSDLSGPARTLATLVANVGNVGTGNDSLWSPTVPARAFTGDSTVGAAVSFEAAGSFAATANNKRLRVYFGSLIFDSGALVTAVAGDWLLRGTIMKTGANTQRCLVSVVFSDPTLNPISKYTALTETTTAAITFGIFGEATADNDVVISVGKLVFAP